MRRLAWSLLLACPLLTSTVRAAEADIQGAGASFPAKVYQQWAAQYAETTGAKLSYVSSGSSNGVQQIVQRKVDFGATDVPLSDAELDKHGLFQFPTLVGGVVPVVNLPGVANGALRLDADVLAALFAGRIGQWNDKAIAALNPGLPLPDLKVTRVVRSDGSGTTEVFARYLNQAGRAGLPLQGGRAAWPGATKAVEGSGKLAEAVKATPGAIGYISSDYLLREQLVAASLRNKQGEWVSPSIDAYRAAIRAGQLFRDSLEAAPLIDLEGTGVWPIVSATYVVVVRAPASLERAGRTLNFFYRSFLLGDNAVAGTGFAPLPIATQARIVAMLAGFRTPDGRPLPVLAAR